MIFENSLPKANFGQNIRDSPNGSLTADSRSLQTATLKPWKESLEVEDSSSKTVGSNWYGSHLLNTLYQSFWSFKSLRNCSDCDLLSFYKGFGRKIFAQISLRICFLLVFGKGKTTKGKTSIVFVLLTCKPLPSLGLK